jgi:phosphoglycerate dehydrogenase-like enzyme
VDILVSAAAFSQFADLLVPAAPGARWLLMRPDGGVVDHAGAPVADPQPEVAWMSNDLFYDGPLGPFVQHLRAAVGLRWLQSGAAGTDSPLFTRFIEAGVRVSTSHVTAVPIAEYVLGSVLAHFQDVAAWRAARAEREWCHHDFREVHGTSWLVIGVGAIGSEVARRARAFGAHVVGVRRHPDGAEPVDVMVGPDDVDAQLPSADVVVLSLPATTATEGLVDAAFLARMRAGSVLVNVARGSLVDEVALVAALDAGVPEHAILDVTQREPLPAASPLWTHPRVTLTPHSSGGGLGRFRRSAQAFVENLPRYLTGAPLTHEVAV